MAAMMQKPRGKIAGIFYLPVSKQCAKNAHCKFGQTDEFLRMQRRPSQLLQFLQQLPLVRET